MPAPAARQRTCWLIASDDISDDNGFAMIARSPLPLVLALGSRNAPADWLDAADGFVLPDDDAAAIGAVLARAAVPATGLRVADMSDGTAQTINALSAEASRIAQQLASFAAGEASDTATDAIGVRVVRRIIKLRRARERFFPAELFAVPAWDMLLDLTAARLGSKRLPVSSLCVGRRCRQLRHCAGSVA